MNDPFDPDDEAREAMGAGPKPWPQLPPVGADLDAVRAYLTQAARLPVGLEVYEAERLGRYGSDPMVVTIRTPGDAPNMLVRFQNQRDASKPAALRGAFGEATGGACRMKWPKPSEASDFHLMLCALSTLAVESTKADDTIGWLTGYLADADHVGGTFTGDGLHEALETLQARQEFNSQRARTWLANDLAPGDRWTLFVDTVTGLQWVRAREFATYVRVVAGVGRLGQHTLDALMAEIGGQRVLRESDTRRIGAGNRRVGVRIALWLYRVPGPISIHSVYARED